MKLPAIALCLPFLIGCATEHLNTKNTPCDNFETNSKLIDDISLGDETSFLEGVELRQCLDGGELEDYYRATGLFLEIKPRKFLTLTKKMYLSSSQLEKMVTMLPLNTTDNAQSKLQMYKNRQELITTYCLPSNQTCNALNEAIQERIVFWSDISEL